MKKIAEYVNKLLQPFIQKMSPLHPTLDISLWNPSKNARRDNCKACLPSFRQNSNRRSFLCIVQTCWMQLSELWASVGIELVDTYMSIDRPKALLIKEAFDTSKAYSYSHLEISFNGFISSYRKSLDQANPNDLLPTLINWTIALFARAQKHHTYENVKDNLFWLIETAMEVDWQRSYPLLVAAEKSRLYELDSSPIVRIKMRECKRLFSSGEDAKALDFLNTFIREIDSKIIIRLLLDWAAQLSSETLVKMLLTACEDQTEPQLQFEIVCTVNQSYIQSYSWPGVRQCYLLQSCMVFERMGQQFARALLQATPLALTLQCRPLCHN